MARPRKSRARQKRRIAERTARNLAAKQATAAQIEKLPERSVTQAPIERYRSHKQIEQYQYEAGTKLYEHWLGMGGHGSMTASYGQTVRGHDHESPYQVRCYQEYRSALQAVGQWLSPVLIDVCIHDRTARDWASVYRGSEKDGIGILRLALDALAVHYGLIRHSQIVVARAARAVVLEQPMLAEVPLPA